ncbi:MAG: hypothetical protein LBT40_02480 [Deltaproteobacteria bacterium]|jgi:hypothetical protein|nr:hypothetical protein [Deltaproteobacteria bacterium]
MKILPFSPPQAGKTPPARAPSAPQSGAGSFEKALSDASSGTAPGNPGVSSALPQPPPAWTVVGSENLRARESASELDLNAAAGLLASIVGAVKSASPEALARLHRLDGMLYYYQV